MKASNGRGGAGAASRHPLSGRPVWLGGDWCYIRFECDIAPVPAYPSGPGRRRPLLSIRGARSRYPAGRPGRSQQWPRLGRDLV